MDTKFKRITIAGLCLIILFSGLSLAARGKKKPHPFDLYDHEMHTPLFEAASVACETCHADPDSFGNREKINKMGCHLCHNNPNPPLAATNECTVCHGKIPPKPKSHLTDWLNKHQVYAKQNPQECVQCHTNAMFCLNCHSRRDTIQTRMHPRNFRFFHSIEARSNPHRCDACHTVDYCQSCHAGRGTSIR